MLFVFRNPIRFVHHLLICCIYSTEALSNREARGCKRGPVSKLRSQNNSLYRPSRQRPYDREEMIRSFKRAHLLLAVSIAILSSALCSAVFLRAQIQAPEDEIVANLAGGRVIVHVARDGNIVFAAIDHP